MILRASVQIVLRGYSIMDGYYKEPTMTAEVLDADGWFHTGGERTATAPLRAGCTACFLPATALAAVCCLSAGGTLHVCIRSGHFYFPVSCM